MLRKRRYSSQGQALVEFALIAIVLLLIVFVIVEASRILWAWITVQNAARAGARYAITGQFDPNCNLSSIPKYDDLCSDDDLLRPAAITEVVHENLAGLQLNEDENSLFPDDYFYDISIYGVDADGVAKGTNWPSPGSPPFAGSPNNPVIVRVYYVVPIVTPLLRPIRPWLPVWGQTVLYNEPFGNLGGTGQSAGVPPPIPPLPTPGVTPTSTPTPTAGPTATTTETPTISPTATEESCPIRYTTSLVAGSTFASVTGVYPGTAVFFDITDPSIPPQPINIVGSSTQAVVTLNEDTGNTQACPGIGETTGLNIPAFYPGQIVLVEHSDGTADVAWVQAGTDTPTPTPTSTTTAMPIPTSTPTDAPPPTPAGPFVQISPTCGFAPSTQIFVSGFNWPTDEDINLFFDGVAQSQIIAPHAGFFQQTWTVNDLEDGNDYTIMAASVSNTETATFEVPCQDTTATPAPATPTNTPSPADLVLLSPPQLVNAPPINEYEPVDFSVVITNTGDLDVNSQFFVDIYFDPDPADIMTDTIPLTYSSGYIAIGSLASGESRLITVTSQVGFTGGFSDRTVYGMVDSLETIIEDDEANNISGPTDVEVTPAATPTPTPTPDPNATDTISGLVRSFLGTWVPQRRAFVWLQDENDPAIVFGPTFTDNNGVYTFVNVPPGTTYTVVACLPSADGDLVGLRPGIFPPNTLASVYMVENSAGCPLP